MWRILLQLPKPDDYLIVTSGERRLGRDPVEREKVASKERRKKSIENDKKNRTAALQLPWQLGG